MIQQQQQQQQLVNCCRCCHQIYQTGSKQRGFGLHLYNYHHHHHGVNKQSFDRFFRSIDWNDEIFFFFFLTHLIIWSMIIVKESALFVIIIVFPITKNMKMKGIIMSSRNIHFISWKKIDGHSKLTIACMYSTWITMTWENSLSPIY